MTTNSSLLSRLRNRPLNIQHSLRFWFSNLWRTHGLRWRVYAAEWSIILLLAYFYSNHTLLNFDSHQLQQTGEHNESATLPLLAEIGLNRYGEIPLWNPYMLTGFSHAGDFVNHFWNPVGTLPVLIWGGINGMKVSIFLSFVLAGFGQWWMAHVFGVRGIFRLWAGLLFIVSGGLALLWRLGWYELLLGAVWFPWCFAALWWALQQRGRRSLVVAAVCVAMVMTTGGGYYPLYLFVSLAVLVGVALLWTKAAERWAKFGRAVMIALFSAGLLAVMLLPMIDAFRFAARDAQPDLLQHGSQPIHYALINYLVSAPEWYNAELLSKSPSASWAYIGFLPLAALLFVPLAYSQARWRRPAISALVALTVVLLVWQASRYPPVSYLYQQIPFLYTFRFPGRLLIIATSPLIILGALGLQHLLLIGRRWGRGRQLALVSQFTEGRSRGVAMRWVLYIALLVVMAFSLRDVYQVNQSVAFAPQQRNAKALTALRWLKNHDPGFYYTNVGGGMIYWDWVPAALEMPIINFRYNRRLRSMDAQAQPESPFAASPKYLIARFDQPRPENAEQVADFDGVGVWYLPNALPFAFHAKPGLLSTAETVTNADVVPLSARLAGPNQVVVRGEVESAAEQLVVLVSDYPGWRLYIDGRPTEMRPVNGYLGAMMQPGEHTYAFIFRPTKHFVGLAISLLTLLVMVAVLLPDSLLRPRLQNSETIQ